MPPRALLRAFTTTVVPSAGELDEDGWRELEGIVAAALAARPPAVARQVRAFLRLVQVLALVTCGRGFAALDDARRTRVLRRLQDSRIRLLRVGFWGLRTLVLMGYYGREEAASALGWAPDPRGLDTPGGVR